MLVSSASLAQTIDFTGLFTSDHCSGKCGDGSATGQPGGFATLTATKTGDSIAISITPNNLNQIISTGFPLSLGFSLVGDPTITYSNLTAGFSVVNGFGTDNLQQNAGFVDKNGDFQLYHMDGFGDFEYGIEWTGDKGGGGHPFTGTTLSFTITAPGLDFTSFQQSVGGDDAAYFALDIISGTNNGKTGLVDASEQPRVTVVSVPGPIAGAGLPGLMALFGFLGWRRMRRRA